MWGSLDCKDILFIIGLILCLLFLFLGADRCILLLACGSRCVGVRWDPVDSVLAFWGPDPSKDTDDGCGINPTTSNAAMGLVDYTSSPLGSGPLSLAVLH